MMSVQLPMARDPTGGLGWRRSPLPRLNRTGLWPVQMKERAWTGTRRKTWWPA